MGIGYQDNLVRTEAQLFFDEFNVCLYDHESNRIIFALFKNRKAVISTSLF